MDILHFCDLLFDAINESDEIDVADIRFEAQSNALVVYMPDGSAFRIACRKLK